MQLPLDEVERFFRLHRSLMFFVNQRLKVVPQKVATPDAYSGLPPETRIEVHQALLGRLDLIDAFVAENPFGFDGGDLDIIRSWKHAVTGTFYAFRQLRDYMVLLTSTEGPVVAYGVVALFDPFEVVIGPYLPRMIETTLLPFHDRIVYDGLIRGYNVAFGGGIKRSLNERYKEARERFGIVTRLPFDPGGARVIEGEPKPRNRATGAGKSRGESSPGEKARRAHDVIVGLTDAFCREHLDDEYGALCRRLAGKLARKRPSPLAGGHPESWASGIVRVIGWVNFLGDPGQPHHMKMTDIDAGFGVSEATGSAKSRAIRDLLKIHPLDPEWTLPARMGDNPMAWMLEVNGLIVDARQMPREFREAAYREGLIPYVPDDGADESAEEGRGARTRRSPANPRFRVGAKVRVKPGVGDPDYPDMPLGGWSGTVTEVIEHEGQVVCVFELDGRTLASIHPIYQRRCEIDGLDYRFMGVGPEDIEPDDGTPVPIEQPTAIVPRPLSPDDQDDRVRMAFGLTRDDLLPEVNEETQHTYARYLLARLTLPFRAQYRPGRRPSSGKPIRLTVTGLHDLDRYEVEGRHGLIALGKEPGGPVEFPLAEIEGIEDGANRRLVEDYAYWLANYG
jgi:hypothetical protein